MAEYEFMLASSLEKVFPDRKPEELPPDAALSLWRGTRGSVQLVYRLRDDRARMPLQQFCVRVSGGPCSCQMRKVQLIPSDFPCYSEHDERYLSTVPGLFPDLLEPLEGNRILPLPGQYRSLWLSWEVPEDAVPGIYPVTIQVCAVEGEKAASGQVYTDPHAAGICRNLHFTMNIGHRDVLPQTLIHTEWFHADCLANYYATESFDERHWKIMEQFICAAGRHGINMLLTPIFTPPLDTAKGGQRRTTQLVDIRVRQGSYQFDFQKLRRWAQLCRKHGICYLEIAHFFTQWGAEATPKIVADVDGCQREIFGWNHPADGPDYREFLQALLPEMQTQLRKLGYDAAHVFYHVSDEPSRDHLQSYQKARSVVRDLIPESQIIDAVSTLEFYQQGLVPHPIPSNDKIEPFFDAGVPDLWVYYCCSQCIDVPNRFFAMDSARNRIMGVLMYLYDVKGFLHWGFNFYSSKYSVHPVDPFAVTHADYGFPSGDPFLVYPGKDGCPLDSLRAEVQDEGLLDLRALQTLEALAGRERTEHLIYEDFPKRRMTFTDYPTDPHWLLHLREKVAAEIDRYAQNEKRG